MTTRCLIGVCVFASSLSPATTPVDRAVVSASPVSAAFHSVTRLSFTWSPLELLNVCGGKRPRAGRPHPNHPRGGVLAIDYCGLGSVICRFSDNRSLPCSLAMHTLVPVLPLAAHFAVSRGSIQLAFTFSFFRHARTLGARFGRAGNRGAALGSISVCTPNRAHRVRPRQRLPFSRLACCGDDRANPARRALCRARSARPAREPVATFHPS